MNRLELLLFYTEIKSIYVKIIQTFKLVCVLLSEFRPGRDVLILHYSPLPPCSLVLHQVTDANVGSSKNSKQNENGLVFSYPPTHLAEMQVGCSIFNLEKRRLFSDS